MTRLFGAILFLLMAVGPSAGAHESCTSIVGSAQDAAAKADWIIEADISNIVRIDQVPRHFEIFIENARMVYTLKKSPRFSTAMLSVDSCFPNSAEVLWGVAAKQINGKRMRFFGTALQVGGGRQVFFMQPAGEPMPPLPQARRQYVSARHTPIMTHSTADGWARVRSTEGPFSIEMPAPADDLTRMEDGEPGFMLRSVDRNGITFMAVFERAGQTSGLGGTFDTMVSKPDAKRTTFKGAEAVSTTGEMARPGADMVSHGLWFRVPGGTYMLSVVTPKQRQVEAVKLRDRFFNSLVFE